MDRFIECKNDPTACGYANLKSNMDRFIEPLIKCFKSGNKNLKSNMDRFIEYYYGKPLMLCYSFKIQYG